MSKVLAASVLAIALTACSGGGGFGGSGSAASGGSTATSSSSGSTGASTGTTGASSTSTGTSGTSGSTGGAACGSASALCSASSPCCTGLLCRAGSCVQPSHEGDACDATAGCANGLSCDATDHCHASCGTTDLCRGLGDGCDGANPCCGSLTCAAGQCVAPDAAAACGGDGDPCTTAADCCGDAAAGLQFACVPGPNGGHICHLGTLGEACDQSTPCGPALECQPSAPATTSASSGSTSGGSGSTSSGSGSTSSGSSSTSSSSSGSTSSGSTSSSSSGSSSTGSTSSGSGSTSSGSSSGSSGSTGIDPSPHVVDPTAGTCVYANGRAGGPGTCSTTSANCYPGDGCNPNRDYCNKGGALVCDPTANVCVPYDTTYASCSHDADCHAPAGASHPQVCAATVLFGDACAPGCTTDADCTGAMPIDQANYNPPNVSTFCDSNGGGALGCQQILCWVSPDLQAQGIPTDTSVLYKPCPGHPNSVCVPQYWGDVTDMVGFCQATQPGAPASTVGQPCSNASSGLSSDVLCGPDATCLGGVCQAICDAAPYGEANGGPTCPASQTCISAQGLNLVSTWQVGGCGTPCDPWTADETQSGCASFCGGPAARCDWIFGDPISGQPLGYCGKAPAAPAPEGGACTTDADCAQGASCLGDGQGGAECVRICDLQAAAGTPDSCPSGQRCHGFTSSSGAQVFQHAGYCN